MDRRAEFEVKCDRVRSLIAKFHLKAVVYSRRSNFAWLTGGGQNHVSHSSDFGVGHLMVTEDKVYLLTNNIEAVRLLDEECAGLDLTTLVYPWQSESLDRPRMFREVVGGRPCGSDGPFAGIDLAAATTAIRHPLLPSEVQRYRILGPEVAGVLEGVSRSVRKGITEHEVASELAAKCQVMGIEANARLVAFDDRLLRYRHPIPTDNRLQKTALIVVGARRHGLTVSASRMVSVGPVDAELRKRHFAVCRIDAILNQASRPGTPLKEIFGAGVEEYERQGFPEEWKLHHQGGVTAYEGRDEKGSPTSSWVLNAPTAVAWNPSITGTKSEDTFLVTEEGIENLSWTGHWPYLPIETPAGVLHRCDILEVN